MNWGHKIALVIIAFIITMLGMVYFASLQTNEMFDDNYYAKELKYQELIDASGRLKAISKEPLVTQEKERLLIKIPEHLYNNVKNSSVSLLKNSDQLKDIEQTLQPDSSGIHFISKSILSKGFYIVRVKWENDSILYYAEQNIQIY